MIFILFIDIVDADVEEVIFKTEQAKSSTGNILNYRFSDVLKISNNENSMSSEMLSHLSSY